MDLQLSGQVALVTGSTAGIGLAIARRLGREGARVIINGRSQERVDHAAQALKTDGIRPENIMTFAGDVSDAAHADRLTKTFPTVDILINNMGIYEPKPFQQITDDDWLRFFNINVLSGIRLSRHYLPEMLKADRGRIIFISSESGVCPPTEMIHYGMTKTAQLAVSRGLAQLCIGSKVTVNTVLPGPTWSEGVEQFVKDVAAERGISAEAVEKDFFQTVRPNSLIKRFATVDEVADMVAFVASSLASATSGAALRCEGGIIPTIA